MNNVWWRDRNFIAGLSVDRLEEILLDFGWERNDSKHRDAKAIIYSFENTKSIVLPDKNHKHIDNPRRWRVTFERIGEWLGITSDDLMAELRDDYE